MVSGSNPDQNRTTELVYNSDGLVTDLIAHNSTTGNQTTKYVYGSAVSFASPGPDVHRNDLLRAVIYPDSLDTYSGGTLNDGAGGYDRVEYKYNRQGEVIELKDQNGTVHAYDYDKIGRRKADKVTSLPSTIDDDVLRLEWAYEDRGMLEKATSYNAATGGSVVNEVALVYNGFGQLTDDKQEHGPGIVGMNTPKVHYDYADGSANHARLTKLTYPNQRKLHYTYGSSGSHADRLSRVDAIKADNAGAPGNVIAAYTYLGLGQIVRGDFRLDARLIYQLNHGVGNDPHDAGLDRFDRVIDVKWFATTAVTFERIKHGYDRAGNRLWREQVMAAGQTPARHYDERYYYDGLYQLREFLRGNLVGTAPYTIDSNGRKLEQEWTFDNTGNWATFKEDSDGNGFWDLNQTRTHSKANEVTALSGYGTQVDHDRAGNMTKCPKMNDWNAHFDLKYDAWNRLVEVKDGQTVVATYAYDGLNRRTKSVTSQTRHFYYSRDWQVLEERVGTATIADRHFVWGIRYVDDLILRDVDTTPTPDGVFDERLWAIQDANFNVTAFVDDTGVVGERYFYTAYGVMTAFDPDYANVITSPMPEYRYAGYRWDFETGFMQVRKGAIAPVARGTGQFRDFRRFEDGNLAGNEAFVRQSDRFSRQFPVLAPVRIALPA